MNHRFLAFLAGKCYTQGMLDEHESYHHDGETACQQVIDTAMPDGTGPVLARDFATLVEAYDSGYFDNEARNQQNVY